MSFLKVLPLAIVMVTGPQILCAIFLATGEGWRSNSGAFVGGAALSISIVVSLAYLIGFGAIDAGESRAPLQVVILLLIVVAMVRTFLERETSKPPAWMGRLQEATPRFSFRLGFLLLGVFPSDILTSVAVGSYLAAQDAPLIDGFPFLVATLLLLAFPALAVILIGKRAEAALPTVRDWMNANSWIVSEVVLVFFASLVLRGLLG
jgi:hypothetical protein